MAEENEGDYAEKAAREWYAGELAAAQREAARGHGMGNVPCAYCKGQVNAVKVKIGGLAAVIRRHVADNIDEVNGSLMR